MIDAAKSPTTYQSPPCEHQGAHSHDVHDLSSEDISQRLQTAEQICAAKQARFTPLRRTVYQLILESEKPLGAYDLIQSLQQDRKKQAGDKAKMVAPPTIYRTLEFLLEFGFIHQLTSINAFVPCGHPRDEHNAVFLLCNDCQRVQEFSGLPVQEIVGYVKNEVGFKVEQSVMELKGLCQTCSPVPSNLSEDA